MDVDDNSVAKVVGRHQHHHHHYQQQQHQHNAIKSGRVALQVERMELFALSGQIKNNLIQQLFMEGKRRAGRILFGAGLPNKRARYSNNNKNSANLVQKHI